MKARYLTCNIICGNTVSCKPAIIGLNTKVAKMWLQDGGQKMFLI